MEFGDEGGGVVVGTENEGAAADVAEERGVGDDGVGEGTPEEEEGDEKCVSIFGVVVAGRSSGAIVVVAGAIVVAVGSGRDIENAHPNALEASSGLAARSSPVSSKIIGR